MSDAISGGKDAGTTISATARPIATIPIQVVFSFKRPLIQVTVFVSIGVSLTVYQLFIKSKD
jgi:hypothetical protein